MFTPHLPPEHAANALLPVMLAGELRRHGVSVQFVAHPAADAADTPAPDVVYVPRRGRSTVARSPLGAAAAAGQMAIAAASAVHACDVVHLHSNGLIIEVGEWLARRYRKPSVITLYGTDVWDHDPARHRRFGDAVRAAEHRVFYSRKLLEFAEPLRLAVPPASVVYAPVAAELAPLPDAERERLRAGLGVEARKVLLTVKRLHPVGGYGTLLDAIPLVVAEAPAAIFWIAGEGELRHELEDSVRAMKLQEHVRFFGRVDHASIGKYFAAADLFVLPSHLESWGTVMLEALASGTRVVASDTAGGLEVREHFPEDVTLVERRDPRALARAILAALESPSRVSAAAHVKLRAEFSVDRCASAYLQIYREVLGASRAA